MNVLGHSEAEVAWAAGLFEGEGCITAEGPGGRYVRLALATTDRDVLDHFVAIVGCGAVHQRKSSGETHRTVYQWNANGRATIPVLEALLPWLGTRRRARAVVALAKARDIRLSSADKTHCPKGHPYDEKNTCRLTRGGRLCRTCARDRERAKRLIKEAA